MTKKELIAKLRQLYVLTTNKNGYIDLTEQSCELIIDELLKENGLLNLEKEENEEVTTNE
jgi:hypothetical protein